MSTCSRNSCLSRTACLRAQPSERARIAWKSGKQFLSGKNGTLLVASSPKKKLSHCYRSIVYLSASQTTDCISEKEHKELGPPIIDIGDWDEATVSQICNAASKWGFFQITNHGVDEKIIADFDRHCIEFFEHKPKAYKYMIKRNEQNSRGYFDDELTKQTLDWKEGVDIGAQDGDLNGTSAVDGFNQWHDDKDGLQLKFAAETYFHSMETLTRKLLSALAIGLDQEASHFDSLFETHTSYLRLNHYPPCEKAAYTGSRDAFGEDTYNSEEEGGDLLLQSPDPEKQGYLSINRHTDAGLLTVLRQKHHEPHSLQVFVDETEYERGKDHETRQGRWVTVHPAENAFTINIGDMMQVYSNDRYFSNLHRVLANRERHRHSAPFFFNPPYCEDARPLNKKEEPKYRPVNWGEFRRRRFEGDFADVGKEVQISQYRTDASGK